MIHISSRVVIGLSDRYKIIIIPGHSVIKICAIWSNLIPGIKKINDFEIKIARDTSNTEGFADYTVDLPAK